MQEENGQLPERTQEAIARMLEASATNRAIDAWIDSQIAAQKVWHMPVKEWTEEAERRIRANEGAIYYEGGGYWISVPAEEKQLGETEYLYTLGDGSLLRYYDWVVSAPDRRVR